MYSYTNRSGFAFSDSARHTSQLAVIQSVLSRDLPVFGNSVLGGRGEEIVREEGSEGKVLGDSARVVTRVL